MEEKLSTVLLSIIESVNPSKIYDEQLSKERGLSKISKDSFLESVENLKGRLPAFDDGRRVLFSSQNNDQEYTNILLRLAIYGEFISAVKRYHTEL